MAVVLAMASAAAAEGAHVNAVYRREVEKFRAGIIKDLKQNWLPLAGLFWLKPGENAFGSDPQNPVALPAGTAPAQAGVFERKGDQVTIKVAPGVMATIDGQPVTTTKLQPDTAGKPSVVALNALRMHVIRRGEKIGIRVKDLNSQKLRDFTSLSFYPIDAEYRVIARWVPAKSTKTINMPNVVGDLTPMPVEGKAVFKFNGQELRLVGLSGEAGKGLFFVFSDTTSKSETYPAGRFLETDPAENGTVVLDFNKAYNPPCAVTPYATCPLAPKENRLPVAIRAGEKYDEHH